MHIASRGCVCKTCAVRERVLPRFILRHATPRCISFRVQRQSALKHCCIHTNGSFSRIVSYAHDASALRAASRMLLHAQCSKSAFFFELIDGLSNGSAKVHCLVSPQLHTHLIILFLALLAKRCITNVAVKIKINLIVSLCHRVLKLKTL